MIFIKSFVIFILLFLQMVAAYGTDSIRFSKAVQRLNSLDTEAFRESVDSILENLEKTTDFRLKVLFTKQVYDITEQKDELAHIRSLCYKAIYSDTSHPELFGIALELAKKNKSLNWMQYVEDRWARYYIASRQYDSAMIHLLKMKDMWPEENRDAQYLNILHLLGDMYFDAAQYDKADSIYSDIYNQYINNGPLNFWRPYVIINNLGLIQMRENNYQQAINWFSLCIKLASDSLKQPYKTNLLAYSKIKLAETNLKMGNINEASNYLYQVESYPEDLIYNDVKQEINYLKSKLFLSKGNYKEAIKYAKKLMVHEPNFISFKQYFPSVYLIISDAYSHINIVDSSLKYLQKYAQVSTLIEHDNSLTKSMIIYAENQNKETNNELKLFQDKYDIALVWILVIIIIGGLLFLIYRLVFRRKILLLEKSLQKIKDGSDIKNNNGNNKANDRNPLEQRDLVEKLQALMTIKKLFLNPELTITKTADELYTNRTYLSNALNDVLKKSFPSYINEYRINEAITLITKDFTSKHTIEALAHKSGFANRSVFNKVFKGQTGMTPSFFIRNYKSKYLK